MTATTTIKTTVWTTFPAATQMNETGEKIPHDHHGRTGGGMSKKGRGYGVSNEAERVIMESVAACAKKLHPHRSCPTFVAEGKSPTASSH